LIKRDTFLQTAVTKLSFRHGLHMVLADDVMIVRCMLINSQDINKNTKFNWNTPG